MVPDLEFLPPELRNAFEKMLELPEAYRRHLSDRLAESVYRMDAELAATVARRVAELEAGTVETIPAEQVFREARERLERK